MNYRDLMQYMNDASTRFGYSGSFDDAEIVFKPSATFDMRTSVPISVHSARIIIDGKGKAIIELTDKEI
jgi:hypothetical protein